MTCGQFCSDQFITIRKEITSISITSEFWLKKKIITWTTELEVKGLADTLELPQFHTAP